AAASTTIGKITTSAAVKVDISAAANITIGEPTPRTPRRRNRQHPMQELIKTVLQQREPKWREGFPTPQEMPRDKVQAHAMHILGKDPRTAHLVYRKIRHSLWKAMGWVT